MMAQALVNGYPILKGDMIYHIGERDFLKVVDISQGIILQTTAGNRISLTYTGTMRNAGGRQGHQMLFWQDITRLAPRKNDPLYSVMPTIMHSITATVVLMEAVVDPLVTPPITAPSNGLISGDPVEIGDRLFHIGNREMMTVVDIGDRLILQTAKGTTVQLNTDGTGITAPLKPRHQMVFWQDITQSQPKPNDALYELIPELHAFLVERLPMP